MELALGTLALRPYVFGFLAAFLLAGARDLGFNRTLLFGAAVWPVAWLSEFASTRIGVPFGLYHYTGETRGQELYIADVPFMDSLSFTFLAYAAWCLARLTTRGRPLSRPALALVAGGLMMALDVVIDPLAVRGDQWFLGRIFFYPEPGLYFGVPLSNFAGWVIVGAAGVALYLWLAGDGRGADPRAGTGLYYAVLLFNLVVTAWIGHWWLATVGTLLHVALAVVLWQVARRTLGRVTFGTRGVETSMRVEW